MQNKTKRLTETAMLLAMGVVLEMVSKMIIPPMTFGGQLTIVHMLPVVLIAYRYGTKWGLVGGFAYALIQCVLGLDGITAAFLPGSDDYMGLNAVLMLLLDYILAYTAMGLAGVFRDRIQKPGVSLMAGSILALSARYVCHIASGFILYSSWAEWYFTQEGFPAWGAELVNSLSAEMLGFVYSVVYNGTFMIPEIILTAAAALLLARIPKIVVKID